MGFYLGRGFDQLKDRIKEKRIARNVQKARDRQAYQGVYQAERAKALREKAKTEARQKVLNPRSRRVADALVSGSIKTIRGFKKKPKKFSRGRRIPTRATNVFYMSQQPVQGNVQPIQSEQRDIALGFRKDKMPFDLRRD